MTPYAKRKMRMAATAYLEKRGITTFERYLLLRNDMVLTPAIQKRIYQLIQCGYWPIDPRAFISGGPTLPS